MSRFLLPALLVSLMLASSLRAEEPAAPAPQKPANPQLLIKTTMGNITVELWPDAAPRTVATFMDLAAGKGTFTDVRNPAKKVTIKKPFYDGLKFHRVIKGFMLQGGCPNGNGTGDAGFEFADEMSAAALGLDKIKAIQHGRPHPWFGPGRGGSERFQQTVVVPLLKSMGLTNQTAIQAQAAKIAARVNAMSLMEAYQLGGYTYENRLPSKQNKRGTLALANKGPNTNSSQFFLNLVDTPHLTGKHTVFGRVIKGMDVVDKIGAVAVGAQAKPVEDVKIISIRPVK